MATIVLAGTMKVIHNAASLALWLNRGREKSACTPTAKIWRWSTNFAQQQVALNCRTRRHDGLGAPASHCLDKIRKETFQYGIHSRRALGAPRLTARKGWMDQHLLATKQLLELSAQQWVYITRPFGLRSPCEVFVAGDKKKRNEM